MTHPDDPHTAVLKLVGDVDTASTGRFALQAQRMLADEDVQRMAVDMAEVTFIDSSGIALLVQIRAACARAGILLELTRPARNTRSLLKLSGLTDAFDIRG